MVEENLESGFLRTSLGIDAYLLCTGLGYARAAELSKITGRPAFRTIPCVGKEETNR